MAVDTLLCTVGTSFLGNLNNIPADRENYLESKPGRDLGEIFLPAVQKLKEYRDAGRWEALGETLASLPESAMFCGAEINSIASRSEPSFPRHHYPGKFKEYVNKIWKETPWITNCYSVDYAGQRAIKGTGFHLREHHDEGGAHHPDRIIGTYIDRNNFKGRFVVNTTGRSREDLVWAVDYLNRKYGS